MRILHICSARAIGGGEKHVATLVNGLTRRGHEIFVALVPESPVRNLLAHIAPHKVIELPMRNALSVRSAWKLAEFSRSNEIQIVHAHLARDYPLAALAASRSTARLVLTRHVMFPLGRVHKLTLRNVARIIAVSRAVGEALREQRIFPAAKVCVIHNGIDVDLFAQARARSTAAKGAPLRVGTIGELSPVKSQTDLVRAAQQICAARDDIEFVIAGEDRSRAADSRTALENLIHESGLARRVHLLGWIDDLPSLLGSIDVFVSTSRSESFGLAMVEAMASRVPVVATASAGATEIIEPNVTGRLVPIGDARALADAITGLLENATERRQLSDAAEKRVRKEFSAEVMVEKTEQLYREVLDQATAAGP